MRAHIRKLIEEAQRPADPIALEHPRGPAVRLASEAIRLARLAASTHMILSARMAFSEVDQAATPRPGEDSA